MQIAIQTANGLAERALARLRPSPTFREGVRTASSVTSRWLPLDTYTPHITAGPGALRVFEGVVGGASRVKRGIGIHFSCFTDGPTRAILSTHAPLGERTGHAGGPESGAGSLGSHHVNRSSVGCETQSPGNPATRGPWPGQKVIRAPWAPWSGGYVLPSLAQMRELDGLVAWLMTKGVKADFCAVQGDEFIVDTVPVELRSPGIVAHGHLTKNRADGYMQTLIHWLVLVGGRSVARAWEECAELSASARKRDGTWVIELPSARPSRAVLAGLLGGAVVGVGGGV